MLHSLINHPATYFLQHTSNKWTAFYEASPIGTYETKEAATMAVKKHSQDNEGN